MGLRVRSREHVTTLTALLSGISLLIVFGAVLQLLPVGMLPRIEPLVDAVPHLNAMFSISAIGTIVLGVREIRRGNVNRHRSYMLASFVLFASFLTLYLYRVSLLGPSPFPGPETVRTFVYLPFLAVHILLAVICIPFVFYALLVAGTRPVEQIYATNHRRIGRIAASLWLISFAMGLVIYALLYHVY